MKIIKRWKQPILVVGLLLTAAGASALALGVYKKIASEAQEKNGPRVYSPRMTKHEGIPRVISKVKDLQIAGIAISNEGTDEAALHIGIINNSDKAVIAYEFSATDGNHFANRGTDGTVEDPDNPKVAIPPHSFATFEWSLASIYEGMPIYLSAAKFADGSEAGDAQTLKMMRKDFERARERKAKGTQK